MARAIATGPMVFRCLATRPIREVRLPGIQNGHTPFVVLADFGALSLMACFPRPTIQGGSPPF